MCVWTELLGIKEYSALCRDLSASAFSYAENAPNLTINVLDFYFICYSLLKF